MRTAALLNGGRPLLLLGILRAVRELRLRDMWEKPRAGRARPSLLVVVAGFAAGLAGFLARLAQLLAGLGGQRVA